MYLLQKLNNSFSKCIKFKFNHQSCTKLSITIFQQTNYKYKCCVLYTVCVWYVPYVYMHMVRSYVYGMAICTTQVYLLYYYCLHATYS